MAITNKAILPLVVLLLIGLGTILVTTLTPRDISLEVVREESLTNDNSLADHVSRGLTGAVLFLCLIMIIRSGTYEHNSRASGELGLWFFYFMFFSLAVISPAVFGEVPAFKIRLLYAPFILFAMYRAPMISTKRLAVITKIILFAFVYGSLFAMVLVPEKAIQENYKGFLPGVDFRLFGVASHPNSLGPVTAAALGLEVISPSRRIIVRVLNLLAAIAVLVLAQSKTVWVCAVLIGCYFLVLKINQLLRGEKIFHINWRGFALYVLIMAIMIGVAGNFIDLSGYERVAEIKSLTGRNVIWEITFDVWRKSPWFGYGLGLWDTDFRILYDLPTAGQAHNQFVHTLGMAGMVGLAGLLAYLAALYWVAVRVAQRTPVPFLFLIIILMSCMAETPLKNFIIFSEFFILHLLLFVHIIQALKQSGAPSGENLQDKGPEAYETQVYN